MYAVAGRRAFQAKQGLTDRQNVNRKKITSRICVMWDSCAKRRNPMDLAAGVENH